MSMQFTKEDLGPYLRGRLGHEVLVDSVIRVGRGSSRETWCVRLREEGVARALVLRRDYAAGSIIPVPLEKEYFIYEQLGRTGIPIARALWWEQEAGERPFFVREFVHGDWNIPNFVNPDPCFDALRIECAKAHLSALAEVHAVDWQALELDRWIAAPSSPAACAAINIDVILADYYHSRAVAVPIACEAAAWLKARAPAAARLCLCKGTNGLGEEVFRDGKLVALSDWEEASIGDPAADFAYMQGFTANIVRDGKTLWGLQQALDYYESVSGFAIPRQSVEFYGLVRALSLVPMAQSAAASAHRQPRECEIRQCWTGTEVNYNAQRVLAHAMGWLSGLDPKVFDEVHLSVEQS
jgi:aminoglycoside phosphotransferase (APT) family kinase protein